LCGYVGVLCGGGVGEGRGEKAERRDEGRVGMGAGVCVYWGSILGVRVSVGVSVGVCVYVD